jgi:flagellar basal-body rod protein FlgB
MEGVERMTLNMLHRALDAAAFQHQLHLINLTHVNDPSHSPLRMRFSDVMEAAAGSSASALSSTTASQPEVFQMTGERVQVDTETALMASNATHYQALAQGVTRHLALYATALNEGK